MSIKVFKENGTISPYDKVIFNSSTAMTCSNQGGSRSVFHTTSFPTSSSSLPPISSSSRYALPEHSYSDPILCTNAQRSSVTDSIDVNTSLHASDSKSQADQQRNDDDGKTTTESSEGRFLTSDLPKISTHIVQEPSELLKKGPQHQRVASEDDALAALATLPSPATSVHDFPTVHHVKHSQPVRKMSSSSLNADSKNYPHHLLPLEGHIRNDNSAVEYKVNHHTSEDSSPIFEHHNLQQRLLKFGLTRATELIGHYAILKTIGEGSFSKVKLAIDLNSCRKVAIKMIATKGIQDSERLRASVLREVEILKYIDHPNIVGLLDTVETPTHLCLVLEYVSGGELFDYVNDHYENSTEEESKYIFLQLVSILEYLHENGIVHRDLKLENILIDSSIRSPNGPVIKLTDFGLAKFIDKSSPILTTRCGSEEYAAPELISGKPYDGRKTDIWSLGVILYALLVGYLPFNLEAGQSRRQFFSKIIRADFTFPNSEKETGRRSKISREAKDIVRKILQCNPQKRPSLDEIRNNPWLKDITI